MKTKEKELLVLLYDLRGQFISSKEIASRLDISERTVRTYIKRLDPVARAKGAVIEAKQGKGYCLSVEPGHSIDSMISDSRLADIQQPNAIDNAQERRDYIFKKLLLDNENPDQFDLAGRLYVSESTVKKDICAIRPILQNYGLKLVQSENGAYAIQGEEHKKRALIMDYFFRNSKLTSLKEFIDNSGFFEDISSEALLMMIIDETRKENIHLSDIMIQNLMMHLALCIKRVKCGFKLETIQDTPEQVQPSEIRAARAMMDRLSKVSGLKFSQEETDYLVLHIASRAPGAAGSERSNTLVDEVRDVLACINRDSRWDLRNDRLLEAALLDHLVPMLTRLKHNINQANPLTDDLKKSHLEVFELVKKEFSNMPSLKGLEISDDEWAYLALHVMAAAERADEKKKLQVLVICPTGDGSSQLLHSRLMRFFSGNMHIVSETGCFSINDELLKEVDLIISTVNLGPVIFGVPFLHVSVFLNEDDIYAINAFIDARYGKKNQEPADRAFQNEVFDRYFDRSRFLIFDSSYDAEGVVEALTRLVAEGEKDNFVQQMKDQIQLRHKMGSVAFSDTIVVPHPAIPLARKAAFAVGLAPEGIYWDKDHPSIKFFLLMSPSYLGNEGLKSVTAAIVSLLDDEGRQKNMLNNPIFEQFEIMFKPLIRK